jgi:polysaccharide export outer membrane protein
MYTIKVSIAAFFALLAICSPGIAQTTAASSFSGTRPMGEPIDNRIGVFHPAASNGQGPDAAGQQPQSQAIPGISLNKDYRIGPNDLLDVEVLDLDKDNAKRTVRVNAAGSVSLPLIGSTVVAGLTAQQAESHIADRYSEKYLQNPQVSVFIKEFTTERITVDGAVVKPGIYPLTGQITLLRALALAGGFGSIPNTNEVKVFRVNEKGERQVATFDVDLIRAGTNEDPVIKGDDLIVVQRDQKRILFKDSLLKDMVDTLNPFKAIP